MNLLRLITLISFLILCKASGAQYRVTFRINQLPKQPVDTIYLAGNFNRWNPKDPVYALHSASNQFGITLEIGKGMYEYKFTMGGWDKVETAVDGEAIDNRTLFVEKDTIIEIDIAGWANQFPQKPKESTASKNVQILDTAFFIPQLKRHRRIWLYLPESYARTKKQYPVLYMHDGQNVFDHSTSFSGEWGVDETLEQLGNKYGEMIVVAIDNGGEKRMNEYAPYDHESYGEGEGDAYIDFIVQTLMPFINKHFRTKKGGRYNFIAGSSMGGLISLYAVLKYPRKFGAAGVFSPAFWVTPQLKKFAAARAEKLRTRIYFFAGEMESETMVPDMLSVADILKQQSSIEMQTIIRAEGRHNESTWRQEFPEFYKWLGLKYIDKKHQQKKTSIPHQ